MADELTRQNILNSFKAASKARKHHEYKYAIFLRQFIMQWLAEHSQVERYGLDGWQAHELVALIKFMESSIRAPWLKNASETRNRNARKAAKNIEKHKQFKLL